MRRDPGAIADPDAGQGLALSKIEMIGLVEAIEIVDHVDRRRVDDGRVSPALIVGQASEYVRQARSASAEIHVHLVVVE